MFFKAIYLKKVHFLLFLLFLMLQLAMLSGCKSNAGNSLAGAEVEKQLDSFDLEDYTNEKLQNDLKELQGKVVLINFWASWCIPCRDEAPLLQKIHGKYKEKGLVILGINVDDTEDSAKRFLLEYGITYENVNDKDGAIADYYRVQGLPNSFFYNQKGEIAGKWLGGFSEDDLVNIVESLI